MLKHRAVANKKRRKSGKPPKIRMVVEGVGPVPPFNRDAQKIAEEKAVGGKFGGAPWVDWERIGENR